jgi:hypothetical protein
MMNKTPIPNSHYTKEKKKRKLSKQGSTSKLMGKKNGHITRSRSNNTKRRLNKLNSKDSSFNKKRTTSSTSHRTTTTRIKRNNFNSKKSPTPIPKRTIISNYQTPRNSSNKRS